MFPKLKAKYNEQYKIKQYIFFIYIYLYTYNIKWFCSEHLKSTIDHEIINEDFRYKLSIFFYLFM